jgi:hypothetical protein
MTTHSHYPYQKPHTWITCKWHVPKE